MALITRKHLVRYYGALGPRSSRAVSMAAAQGDDCRLEARYGVTLWEFGGAPATRAGMGGVFESVRVYPCCASVRRETRDGPTELMNWRIRVATDFPRRAPRVLPTRLMKADQAASKATTVRPGLRRWPRERAAQRAVVDFCRGRRNLERGLRATGIDADGNRGYLVMKAAAGRNGWYPTLFTYRAVRAWSRLGAQARRLPD